MVFFSIFVIIPMVEILLFMAIGGKIVFLTFLTAVIGGWIVKYQGLTTLAHIRMALDRGQIPLDELFDGICLIIAGATLITPGFLTDFIGFVLLFPPARNMIRYLIRTRTSWGVEGFASTPHEHTRNTPAPGEIIEGDYERVDDK